MQAASRLFRERGIADVGLATVMGDVGLTVGTFYTHFASKEALVQEVLLRSLDARHDHFVTSLRNASFEALVRVYLSPAHRDSAGTGCPVAALVAEVGRQSAETKCTFAAHNAPTLDALAASLSSAQEKTVTRAHAAALLGLLSGTLQIARATPDSAESDAILEAGICAAMRLTNQH